MTQLQQFADLLSLITIGMCFVLKIPQILKLVSVKSADEISMLGLFLELTSYTVMTSYNYTNGYSLLSYLEYPIILAQEYILIFLVLKYLSRINMWSFLGAVIYFAVSSCLLLGIVPKIVLTLLAPMCTPISASSKIVQLLAILRAKNAESVSPLTWFISAFTNLTRVFTIWMDSADILLLGNFIISVLLSSSIMFSALYYRNRALKQD
ncbi:solute carrier family 66 member 3 [Monomorium pharaonis]|uniref:solute carrier family 66 member 3 n=1 Tax=Monomorium pharaonis TaxID=307658 RepID=UPI00063F1552|nr:solute carrier family 66 member 3 [Monomorium pharaonis]XP_012529342.1 solute carrier family 66 member 3 [Monomorium pharaonis]XP_012529343.1 solute carrier family 66 member 3 [Monomorium pharaonis]XP_028047828.1 solute carrier family 66 member 3 [Monomorium pharaonis]XP_028047829.1 solute carrier family 66 member 3 [Monomorium pharaonis]XP_028047830.1 solute carrier family 66 member 3 [Monomorium pharaonis]XP_028047831.1 solute carrier family 66 member 3 [Monomorium pharaonis]XP_02804783